MSGAPPKCPIHGRLHSWPATSAWILRAVKAPTSTARNTTSSFLWARSRTQSPRNDSWSTGPTARVRSRSDGALMVPSDDASGTFGSTSPRIPKGYVPTSISAPPENGPENTASTESLPNHWSTWAELDLLVSKLRVHPCIRPGVTIQGGFEEPTEEERRLIQAKMREHLEHD